ncbi:hypothetical protein RJ639_047413 [Escallonia herrerae]|uniref:UTP23 sensor motif region domain-containing protein n=1 Tax=Escallonia herrerae TaxID=1293975 RepID=A0AA88W8X6_9ASTE|nr:hypothetical protein RJ639_047413 [Escallonia herrerae]
MRFKKQKRHRKTVRFYTACFGFREPFKVLCDGTFINHLIVNRITPADTALSVACITEVLGENNPEHFFVATQDADLRKKFQEIPALPVIFGLRNALFLEPPSVLQHQIAKSAEEERSRMTELEYKMLRMRAKNGKASEEGRDYSDTNEGVGVQDFDNLVIETNNTRKRTYVKDKVQFKRKKAKGPNPLSCKKKKHNGNPNSVPQKESKNGEEVVRNSSRKRKRPRKAKSLAESTA